MADITRTDGKPLPYSARLEVMQSMGYTEVEAVFLLAISDGEIDGDILILDDQGNEVKRVN